MACKARAVLSRLSDPAYRAVGSAQGFGTTVGVGIMADRVRARFSDGHSARALACEVRLEANGLAIDRGPDYEVEVWPYSGLTLDARNKHQSEVTIGLRDLPGAQLTVRDAAAIERLFRIAPQLARPHSRRRWQLLFAALAACSS